VFAGRSSMRPSCSSSASFVAVWRIFGSCGVRADRAFRSTTTLPNVVVPDDGDNWIGLTDQELPIAAAYEWALRPNCGAVVLFSGTVRDHAEGRTDVQHLTYEAYAEQVEPIFATIIGELRDRWPDTGRVVLLHRTGLLQLEESSVIAVVSAPHRPGAFEAARYAIDALKSSAPIWKHEVWADGADWGTDAHVPSDPRTVGTV
jgi:molybdopterin synthase catalytic subunit